MPNYTEKFNLEKPLENEYYDVEVQNRNMDIIDQELSGSSNKIGNLSELDTSDKTDLVGAINEVKDNAETPAGAQAKANQAETNAKNASVSKSGDIMTGGLSAPVYTSTGSGSGFRMSPPDATSGGMFVNNASNIYIGNWATNNNRLQWNLNNGGLSFVEGGTARTVYHSGNLNYNTLNVVNAIASGTSADPNTTQEPYILTNHANSPDNSKYWHIHTYFYSSKTGNRAQQAIEYNPTNGETRMFVRSYFSSWGAWQELGGGGMPVLVASNTLQESFNTERSITIGGGAFRSLLVAKHIPKGAGEIKIQWEMRGSTTSPARMSIVPANQNNIFSTTGLSWETNVGTVLDGRFGSQIMTVESTTYQTVTAIVSVGDRIPFYLVMDSTMQMQVLCRNIRIYYSLVD